jgi:hypothetical protein
MAKKIATPQTRVSSKEKFNTYKNAAYGYILTLLQPKKQEAFRLTAYEVTPTGKKPNALSVPEVLAIVGTASKLGKNVQIEISGVGDNATLSAYFVDRPAPTPDYLEF